jgi:hypothetical protein
MRLKPRYVYAIAGALALAEIGTAAAFKGTETESWIEAALYMVSLGFLGAWFGRDCATRR